MLRRLIRPLARRYRHFMQAEIIAELAAIRLERARLNEGLLRLEEAMITLVLHKPEDL